MRYLTILILSLTFSITLKSQLEFAPPGAVWHQNAAAGDLGTPTWEPLREYFTMEYTGDTIIQGAEYKIVGDYYLRQEGDKIFHWWAESPRLVYDFGAQFGDTLTFEFVSIDALIESTFEVIVADEIIVDGQSLRHLICRSLNGYEDYEYIEKVGSTLRLVDEFYGLAAFPEVDPDWLRCYSDPQIEYRTDKFNSYGGDTLSCDFIPPPTSVIEVDQVRRLVISPNPATDIIQFASGEDVTGPGNITLYNLTGQLIQSEMVILDRKNQISIVNLAPGTYLMHLESDKGQHGIGIVVKR